MVGRPAARRAVGPTLESWGLLDFGGEDVPCEVYGKPFFLVYLLMIPAVQVAHSAGARNRERGNLDLWSWRVMFGALIAAGVGDFVAYGGVSLPGLAGEGVSGLGFSVEFFSMPLLLFASTVYGVAAIRATHSPVGCVPCSRWIR